jgi:hypothetical protein
MKFTIEVESIEEAQTLLAALGVPAAKVAKLRVSGAERVPAPTPAPVPEAKAEAKAASAAAPAATREDAAKAIIALSKAKGRAAAVAVLEQFRPDGYTDPEVKLPAVDKSNYAALVAAATEAAAEEA